MYTKRHIRRCALFVVDNQIQGSSTEPVITDPVLEPVEPEEPSLDGVVDEEVSTGELDGSSLEELTKELDVEVLELLDCEEEELLLDEESLPVVQDIRANTDSNKTMCFPMVF